MPRPQYSPLLLRTAQLVALFLVAAPVSTAALAQSTTPDPLSAGQTTPLNYRSAFEGYRSFRADETPPWRAVNDAVRSVGGHTGSMRDGGNAHQAAPQASSAPEAPAPKAVPSTPVYAEPPPTGHGH